MRTNFITTNKLRLAQKPFNIPGTVGVLEELTLLNWTTRWKYFQRGWRDDGGEGRGGEEVCAFHFVEIFHLVEIFSVNEWKLKRSILNPLKYKKIKLCYSSLLKHFSYVTFLRTILINAIRNALPVKNYWWSSKAWNFNFRFLNYWSNNSEVAVRRFLKNRCS